MRFLILFLLLVLGVSASAEEQVLLKATNDQDSAVDVLTLRLDPKGRPTHLLVRQKGKIAKSFSPAQLKQGAVLTRRSGHDLLSLKTLKFDPEEGSEMILTYLYNGIPPQQHRSLKLFLKRVGDEWEVRDGASKLVKSVHIKANVAGMMGYQKTIGIRSVELNHE